MTELTILTIPGGGGSGPDHWQTHWEAEDERITRMTRSDWVGGTREDWVSSLDEAVKASPLPVIAVAHSLGCVVLAHWAALNPRSRVAGALMVAPADVEACPALDRAPYSAFRPVPTAAFPFPSLLAASTDDPFVTVDRARRLARDWGSALRILGAFGHVGSDSRLGGWAEGRRLLDAVIDAARRPSEPRE